MISLMGLLAVDLIILHLIPVRIQVVVVDYLAADLGVAFSVRISYLFALLVSHIMRVNAKQVCEFALVVVSLDIIGGIALI